MACAQLPTIFTERQSDFTSVTVRQIDETIGKGLFATKPIAEGETIFEENPLVSCQFSWNKAYKYLACDLCLRPLETLNENVQRLAKCPQMSLPHSDSFNEPIIVSKCSFCNTSYCSEECQKFAWTQYHEALCVRDPNPTPSHPLVVLEDIWKNMHFPPETTTVMLMARILATIQQSQDRDALLLQLNQFCQKSVNEEQEIVHKMLLGDTFVQQIGVLRDALTQAFPGSETKQWLTPQGFVSLIAMIGTNGQGIGTSVLAKWVSHCDDLDLPEEDRKQLDLFIDSLYERLDQESGHFLNVEGSGLFSVQSAINHSCSPNTEITFPHNNATLRLVATKSIQSGEEITISYLNDCQVERSRHSRQKTLRENYLFNCECPKCQSQIEEEDVTSEEEMSEDDD